MIPSYQNKEMWILIRRYFQMKGYTTSMGYMGLVDGAYILFSCEEEYREYLEG